MNAKPTPPNRTNTRQEVVSAVAFTANGRRLVGGDRLGVRVWRAQDGKEITTMNARTVQCVAVSKDGKWIAAGTAAGEVLVYDEGTCKQLFALVDIATISGVDFSPDSTRILSASWSRTASVWDIASRMLLVKLRHSDRLNAAKYSPHGERIATATTKLIRVWDSYDGKLLSNIEVEVSGLYNTGLLWSDDSHLFVTSGSKIHEIEVPTRSVVSEWPLPDTNAPSCIAMPQDGRLLAYASENSATLWVTATHTQLCHIPQDFQIHSIALSPDNRFLAMAGAEGKFDIVHLPRTVDTGVVPPPTLHSNIQEPEIHIDDSVLSSWKNGQLAHAEALLTAAIAGSHGPSRHALAGRALVRTHLRQWDTAIIDAEESITIQGSVIGYIAKCMALIGRGKTQEGIRACDIAFQYFHSDHVTILLLIKAVVLCMAGEHDDAISRVDDLMGAIQSNPIFCTVQAYMYFLLGGSQMDSGDYEHAILSFQRAQIQLPNLVTPPLIVLLISRWNFDDLGVKIQQRLCDALCAAGRVMEVEDAILETINTFTVDNHQPVPEWVTDTMRLCLSTPEGSGDATLTVAREDVETLHPTHHRQSTMLLLSEWVKSKLTGGSWEDVLVASASFVLQRFVVFQVLCERLEAIDSITDAVACFRRMGNELPAQLDDEQVDWISNFTSRHLGRFEELGTDAMNAGQYGEAISHYTVALSLSPVHAHSLLVQRSRAYVGSGLWEEALNDANEAIRLDPSSPLGYERKNAALHGAGSYSSAVHVLETMLLKMSQSSDPDVRDRSFLYVHPEQTKETIRTAIEKVLRELPPVLIDIQSGRLLDKSCQASSFESQPIFHELVSSMITDIDHARIEHEVTQYYRYATFSDAPEGNEELFETVMDVAIYDIEKSPAHNKLRMFCKVVQDAGFLWAWSTTCCIDRKDQSVLQEALVSMFRWYEGSALTVVFLLGVLHTSVERGALARSIWNTCPWALQAYHASKVVRFYTEDWAPYMDATIYNHKESPEVVSEMEQVTGIPTRMLMTFRPGLGNIREKLHLASTRTTTRVEDTAYSLLGLFSLSIPIVYGEGDKALGRLLMELLIRSGDTSILAWTGTSGSFNSALPESVTVFNQSLSTHIPPCLTSAEIETASTELLASSFSINLATKLYDRLYELPAPSFMEQRVKLPCLSFKVGRVLASRNGSENVFHADTATLGVAEIRTNEDISRFNNLYLIHPWINFLLDRRPVGSIKGTVQEDMGSVTFLDEPPSFAASNTMPPQTRPARIASYFARPFGGRRVAAAQDTSPFLSSTPSLTEKQVEVLGLIARLRKPFGGILLTPTRQNAGEYRRLAVDCLIIVQVKEMTPVILEKLIQSVRMLDVL